MAQNKLKILAGLGNPGKQFQQHRHNVGYWLIDEIARTHQLAKKERPGYDYYPWQHDYGVTYLFRSHSYMNDSGVALQQMMHYFKVPVESVLLAYDEMDFDPGVVRVKRKGGAGGHNGVKSVIQHVGPAIMRLRFGVGRPLDVEQVRSYVLSSPTAKDQQSIDSAIQLSIENIELLCKGQYDEYIEILHTETK